MNNIIKNLNILYVEDDNTTREFITKTLKLMSDNVISVSSISDAKSIYDNNYIDILVSDINVDGDCGISFVKDIREKNKYIPIILLSAHSNKEFLFEAIKLNLIDYIVKPISYEILNKAIKSSINQIMDNGSLEIEFISGIKYNIKQKIAVKDNEVVKFTVTELKLLEFLLKNKDNMINSDEIKYYVWEDDFASDGALKSLINKVRNKIGKESIKNQSGLGYKVVLKGN